MSIAPITDEASSPRCIPDVTDLSLFEAACVYAQNGLYVLPVKVGKHPGSIVGSEWQYQSTTDLDVIESYWDRHPQAGIALHTGKSGVVACDLDVDVLPDELAWLRAGLFQATRHGGSARGHYVFTSGQTFVCGKLSTADGTVVGDVRSGNSVIIAQPSPHAKADVGGRYRWQTTGAVPALPDAARRYVRVNGATVRGGVAVVATSERVAEALAQWSHDDRPNALAGPVNAIRSARGGTRDLVRDVLRFTAGEARIGFYPLARAVKEIKSAAVESYTQRGDSFDVHIGEYEFARLVGNGVGYALSRTVEEIEAEANGDYGQGRRYGPRSIGYVPAFKPLFQPAFKPILPGKFR